jgi:hypothetical protein
MKRCLMVLAVLTFWAGGAYAAPGDPRVVQGFLEWPSTLSTEPFVVIRGEDGRLYYTDISAAQRRPAASSVTAGSRVAALAVEGNRPHELAAIAFGAGDAGSLGLTVPPTVPAPSASIASTPTALSAPADPMWRLDGTVQSLGGTLLTVQRDDGKTRTVDVSQLSPLTIQALRRGDRVTLFGVPRSDDKLVANGYVQTTEPASPSASPRLQ